MSFQAWSEVLCSALAEASCQPGLSIPATSELRQEDEKLKAYLSYRHTLSQVLPLTLHSHPKPSIWSTVRGLNLVQPLGQQHHMGKDSGASAGTRETGGREGPIPYAVEQWN